MITLKIDLNRRDIPPNFSRLELQAILEEALTTKQKGRLDKVFKGVDTKEVKDEVDLVKRNSELYFLDIQVVVRIPNG